MEVVEYILGGRTRAVCMRKKNFLSSSYIVELGSVTVKLVVAFVGMMMRMMVMTWIM